MARYASGQRCFCVRVGTRGRITIPKPVRDQLGWRPGDEIVVRVEGGVAILTKRGVPDGGYADYAPSEHEGEMVEADGAHGGAVDLLVC